MKHWSGILLVAVFICVLSAPAFARDEVLVGGPIEHGGYGGPSLKVGPVMDKARFFIGGYGGWYINHTFMIGGGGYGLINEVKAPVSGKQGEKLYFEMGYGGLVLEYVNKSHRLVHFTINTLLGGGGIQYRSSEDWPFNYKDDSFFIVEPCICVELNITTHFRMGLGVGYRYIDGVDLPGITDEDLTGVVANFDLKFGSF
ncbi:MAG TPA: hypothetical protein GXZ97_01780 [Hydrogenispora sp.]|jgi:hypothetical protein|nr:hypothetical protein [Hydrogenispora sp.]